MNKSWISSSQALTLLFLCRIFTLLTVSPASPDTGESLGGGMAVLAPLASLGFQLLLFLPGWLLMRRHPGQNFAQALTGNLGGLGRSASLLLWLFLTVMAALSAVEFEQFLITAVYADAPKLLFAFLFLLVAIYGSHLGVEAFGRFAYFGFVLFAALTGTLLLALAGDFRMSELFAKTPGSAQDFLGAAWAITSGNLEIVCFFLLLPQISGTGKGAFGAIGKKLYFGWSILFSLVSAGLLLLLIGVLGGGSGGGKPYPFYTLAMAAEGTLLARTDAIHMSVWSVLGLLRCCLLLYGANTALRCGVTVTQKQGMRRFVAEHREGVTAVVVVLTAALFSLSDRQALQQIRLIWRGGTVVFLALVALPLAGILGGWLKRHGRRLDDGVGGTGKAV